MHISAFITLYNMLKLLIQRPTHLITFFVVYMCAQPRTQAPPSEREKGPGIVCTRMRIIKTNLLGRMMRSRDVFKHPIYIDACAPMNR